MKVLIADDDRVLSLLLSTRLKAKGWQVQTAYDAMQAVMFAIRTEPDVITLDINMPVGTGIEALKKLRQSAKTNGTPIVVISGSVAAEDEEKIKALGADAIVRKPPDPEELNALLLRLTGGG